MICIYKITSPSNKVYIGQAYDLDKRVKRYKNLSCKAQKKLYNSFVKYGFSNHIINVVYEFPVDVDASTVNDYEQLFIEQYKNCGLEMLNLTIGGRGCKGYVYTEDVKKRISDAKSGKKKPAETKLRMSVYHKNRPISHAVNNAKARSKKVVQYTLDGEFIKEWPSLISVTSTMKGDIRACINGKQKRAGGFMWEYASSRSNDIQHKIKELEKLAQANEVIRRGKISAFFKQIPVTNYLAL